MGYGLEKEMEVDMDRCSCVIVPNDSFDYPEIYRRHDRKARKVHKCCECGREIRPGEKYNYAWGVWIKSIEYHRCADCQSIADAYFCDTAPFAGLEEEIFNTFVYSGEDINLLLKDDCVKNLTKAAKERIFEIVEKQWEKDGE